MKPRFSAATNRSPTWDPDFTRGSGCAAYEAETLAEFVLHAWMTKLMGEISASRKVRHGAWPREHLPPDPDSRERTVRKTTTRRRAVFSSRRHKS